MQKNTEKAHSKRKHIDASTAASAVFSCLLGILITGMGVITLVFNEDTSEEENRPLVTFASAFDEVCNADEVIVNLTDAYSDQMAFRTFFSTVYYTINPVAKLSADVAINTDPVDVQTSSVAFDDLNPGIQLFEEEEEPKTDAEIKSDAEKCTTVLNAVSAMVKEKSPDTKFIFLSVPRKDAVMTAYLPDGYASSEESYKSELKQIEAGVSGDVTVLDAYSIFKENEDEVPRPYLGTDHHFTPYGGFIVYKALAALVAQDNSDFKILDITTDYTLEARLVKGGFIDKIAGAASYNPEYLCVKYNHELNYTRTVNGEDSDEPVYGDGNRYGRAFMNSMHPESIVTVEENEGQPTILFVGTSHNLIVEAFCVPSCYQCIDVDYRSEYLGDWEPRDISYYLEHYNVDYIVFTPARADESFGYKNFVEQAGPAFADIIEED